jgi:hypothetical protein
MKDVGGGDLGTKITSQTIGNKIYMLCIDLFYQKVKERQVGRAGIRGKQLFKWDKIANNNLKEVGRKIEPGHRN